MVPPVHACRRITRRSWRSSHQQTAWPSPIPAAFRGAGCSARRPSPCSRGGPTQGVPLADSDRLPGAVFDNRTLASWFTCWDARSARAQPVATALPAPGELPNQPAGRRQRPAAAGRAAATAPCPTTCRTTRDAPWLLERDNRRTPGRRHQPSSTSQSPVVYADPIALRGTCSTCSPVTASSDDDRRPRQAWTPARLVADAGLEAERLAVARCGSSSQTPAVKPSGRHQVLYALMLRRSAGTSPVAVVPFRATSRTRIP